MLSPPCTNVEPPYWEFSGDSNGALLSFGEEDSQCHWRYKTTLVCSYTAPSKLHIKWKSSRCFCLWCSVVFSASFKLAASSVRLSRCVLSVTSMWNPGCLKPCKYTHVIFISTGRFVTYNIRFAKAGVTESNGKAYQRILCIIKSGFIPCSSHS